jgi:hypothetical protein
MMDPMEKLIADALDAVGASYTTDFGGGNPSCLDFRLSSGIEIEVKRFHTPRIAEQMARADNVIVAQGEWAVRFLAFLIRASAAAKDEPPPLAITAGVILSAGNG